MNLGRLFECDIDDQSIWELAESMSPPKVQLAELNTSLTYPTGLIFTED